jgi:hypothetical protein
MTQNNNSQVSRSNDPEQIDLLDLMLQLWRGKWMIATFVVVFIALAVGYLFVAKKSGPQVQLLRNLMRLRLHLFKCIEYPLWYRCTFNAGYSNARYWPF